MLNPNGNGYRPEPTTTPKDTPSARITCPTFNGESSSYALREAKDYSKIMKPVEAKASSVIVYQSTNMKVGV